MGPGAGTETPVIGIDVLITVAAVIAAITVITVLIIFIGRRKRVSEDENAVVPEVSMSEDIIAQLKEEYGVSDDEENEEKQGVSDEKDEG
ncbi:MAG TPA: hypothetical protein PLM42_07200 [Methanothermobacter thermautotrophicus]|nr:hypothetical protein [Methanothermobacter thermautotrophicus]